MIGRASAKLFLTNSEYTETNPVKVDLEFYKPDFFSKLVRYVDFVGLE